MDLRAEHILTGCMLGLTLAACTHESAGPPKPGFYSSLRYIPEAGDQLGLNLTLLGDPPNAVEFENCEGTCNGSHRFRVTVRGNAVSFDVVEPVVGQDGKAVDPSSYRVVLRPKHTLMGPRLLATFPGNAEASPEVLKRRKPWPSTSGNAKP